MKLKKGSGIERSNGLLPEVTLWYFGRALFDAAAWIAVARLNYLNEYNGTPSPLMSAVKYLRMGAHIGGPWAGLKNIFQQNENWDLPADYWLATTAAFGNAKTRKRGRAAR